MFCLILLDYFLQKKRTLWFCLQIMFRNQYDSDVTVWSPQVNIFSIGFDFNKLFLSITDLRFVLLVAYFFFIFFKPFLPWLLPLTVGIRPFFMLLVGRDGSPSPVEF